MIDNKIIKLTDNNFNDYIISCSKLILIDFWAEWCSPCKAFSLVLDKIVDEYINLIIAKVNVDDSLLVTKKYKVKSIPTSLLFKNGCVVAEKIGSSSFQEMKIFLDKYLL
ncbi:thioredoxin domain-containing protein [Candidatus Purcelliella pentastirinorum]|nr:thioredoxin domain-containing protein [Candidatus Purcelliella pentastirinorum]WDI78898.1 thioredoxin domain-containing protein [Candidatus Purcelliella pentastirinorum]WDR80032.1 thioredoxin domain-containing protein [Candidatus Purcelliella pentastirinorum]